MINDKSQRNRVIGYGGALNYSKISNTHDNFIRPAFYALKTYNVLLC